MFDEHGRVWFTSRVRPPENPAFCRKGSAHPSAQLFPLERSNRHLSMYDPRTGQFTLITRAFQLTISCSPAMPTTPFGPVRVDRAAGLSAERRLYLVLGDGPRSATRWRWVGPASSGRARPR